MREDDFARFSKAMYALGEVFNRELTEKLLDIYFRSFADFTIEDFEGAAYRAISECKFFPKPAEIRALFEGSADDRGSEAWDTANTARIKSGIFRSVLFEDGFIGQALITVFGGWAGFCEAMHAVYRQADDVSFEDREAARCERREPESRMIRVSGLSDEMTASKRKEFLVAYRNAKRTCQATPYLFGQHEQENRATLSAWTRGKFQIEDGREVFKREICIASARECRYVTASYDRETGLLVQSLPELLSAKPALRALPRPEPRRMLTDGAEMVPPEQGQTFWSETVRELTRRWAMPAAREDMSAEEKEQKRLLIEGQLEKLKAEGRAGNTTEPEEFRKQASGE